MSQAQELFTFCKENILLLDSIYNQRKHNLKKWPETHIYSGDWSYLMLNFNFKNVLKTNTALDALLENTTVAMFSVLRPGTEIVAHQGHRDYCDYVTRCHFCLQNSEDNQLSLETGETINWQRGQGYTFDDTIRHSAYNRGTVDRVVLFVDVLRDPNVRPETYEETRELFPEYFI